MARSLCLLVHILVTALAFIFGYIAAVDASCSVNECDEVGAVLDPELGGFGVVYQKVTAFDIRSVGPLQGQTHQVSQLIDSWDCDNLTMKCEQAFDGNFHEATQSAWDGQGKPSPMAYGNCNSSSRVKRKYCGTVNGNPVDNSWEK